MILIGKEDPFRDTKCQQSDSIISFFNHFHWFHWFNGIDNAVGDRPFTEGHT